MGAARQWIDRLFVVPWRLWVVVVLALVFGNRVFSQWEIPLEARFDSDALDYQTMAVNFAAGLGLKTGGVLPFEDYRFDRDDDAARSLLAADGPRYYFYRAPGYPLLLGWIYAAVGTRPEVVIGLQLLLFVLLLAQLPVLGEALFGRWGFLAGALAGYRMLDADIENINCIGTEAWVMLAAVALLWAWLFWFRKSASLARAALFGATLAAAILLKGIFLFALPWLCAYLLWSCRRREMPGSRSLLAFFVVLAVPVGGYSLFASLHAGHPVLVSTQGSAVLLDGNNEQSVETGRWEPGWRKTEGSFYYRARRAGDLGSPWWATARFYAHHPAWLPKAVARKLNAGFGHPFKGWMVLLILFVGFWLFLQCPGAPRDQAIITVLLIAGVASGWVQPTFVRHLMLLTLLLGFAAARPGLRRRLLERLAEPTRAFFVVVALMLGSVTVVAFGEPRFVFPFQILVELCRVVFFLWMLDSIVQLVRKSATAELA